MALVGGAVVVAMVATLAAVAVVNDARDDDCGIFSPYNGAYSARVSFLFEKKQAILKS